MSTVLITGGSEGIGLELAKIYGRKNRVILVSRSMDKLMRAKQCIDCEQVRTISYDLSKPGSGEALYKMLQEPVHVLINCAGVGYAGKAEDISLDHDEAMVALNCIGLMTLTKLLIQEMKQRHEGTIINVGSTGAFQPGPYIAGYYATKSFVVSYTRAIAEEVKEYGINVYCFCPGPVDTGFYEKSGGKKPAYIMKAEDAAKYLYTHQRKRVLIIPGLLNKLLYYIPSELKMRMVKQMKKRNL